MEVQARLKNYRVSARKARLLADEIRGRGVEDALTVLDLTYDYPAFAHAANLVRSALANATEKNDREKAGIDVDNLVIGRITVDQGSSMWRIRPRAQGRASWIQHKTCHVLVVLSEE